MAFSVGRWMADRVMKMLERSGAELIREPTRDLFDVLRRGGVAVPELGPSETER